MALLTGILVEQASDGGFGEAGEPRLALTWDAWLALERLAPARAADFP